MEKSARTGIQCMRGHRLLLTLGVSVVISACGAESQNNDNASSGQDATVSVAEVAAEPGFLKRGCDGSNSPERFCPKQ